MAVRRPDRPRHRLARSGRWQRLRADRVGRRRHHRRADGGQELRLPRHRAQRPGQPHATTERGDRALHGRYHRARRHSPDRPQGFPDRPQLGARPVERESGPLRGHPRGAPRRRHAREHGRHGRGQRDRPERRHDAARGDRDPARKRQCGDRRRRRRSDPRHRARRHAGDRSRRTTRSGDWVMAKRISELPAAGAVADTDELELNQSGTSRKATRAQIVAGLAAATHVHTLADVTDAGALAAKDAVAEADIANLAVTTAKLADLSVSNSKLALGAVSTGQLADDAVTTAKIVDGAVTAAKIAAGAVGSTQLADNAVGTSKIADGTVTAAKIAAKVVGPGQLEDTAVTPGEFTVATITVDQQPRITAAASGTAGETNTGSNIGIDGVGVFAGKVGADLQFRHIAPASDKVTVTLNGEEIDVDVVESNLQIAASNVTGLAPVATGGTLASLTSLDANGGAPAHQPPPHGPVGG